MKLKVKSTHHQQRLDSFVTEQVSRLSRTFVSKLIDQSKITVNNKSVKAGYKLKTDDQVIIDYDLTQLDTIPEIDLPVLYEDADCVVLNKPTGVLSHSKGTFNPEATVATFLRERLSDLTGERAGIVHRLDRATSGVMIGAKNPAALAWLQKQFSQRRVKKVYYAVIGGELTPGEAVIEIPIERNPKNPKTFRPGSLGKPAVTHYAVVESTGGYSLVKLTPLTGRTHQLRVHLKHLGHPIVGDDMYGGSPADRLYLHAESLEITLPSRERKLFRAPLPASFRQRLTHG